MTQIGYCEDCLHSTIPSGLGLISCRFIEVRQPEQEYGRCKRFDPRSMHRSRPAVTSSTGEIDLPGPYGRRQWLKRMVNLYGLKSIVQP